VFYRNVFKVWSLLTVHREHSSSLYWFLKEPLIYGSILDISQEKSLPALTFNLLRSGVTTLGDLRLAGPDLGNIGKVADHLGVRSIHMVAQILEKWRASLTKGQLRKLGDCFTGACSPDCNDPFPNMTVSQANGMCRCIFTL